MAAEVSARITSYFRGVLGTSNMVRIPFDGESYVRAVQPSRRTDGKQPAGRGRRRGRRDSDYLSVPTDSDSIRAGKLSDRTVSALLQGQSNNRSDTAKEADKELAVLLVPRSVATSKSRTQEALLCIPAVLSLRPHDKGTLSYPGDWATNAPWMPRPLLKEPVDASSRDESSEDALRRKAEFQFGSFGAYEKYVEGNAPERNRIDNLSGLAQWQAYLRYCFRLYQVTTAADQLPADGDATIDEDTYVLVNQQINATANVVDLYDEIHRHLVANPADPDLELYRALTRIHKPRQAAFYSGTSPELAERHCGTMSRAYPLADSQRDAVHAFGQLREGQMLAVSGPPGTGKTTLLESIVADLLVRHAIDGAEAPVIVGTSTNNQAVSNIIDAFGKIEQEPWPSPFARWLPDISYERQQPADGRGDATFRPTYHKDRPLHSLGSYSPSSGKTLSAQAGNYLISDLKRDGSTVYGMALDPHFSKAAPDIYLSQGEAFFRRRFGSGRDAVAKLQEACREELRTIDDLRRLLINAVAAGNTARANKFARALLDHLRRASNDTALPEEALHSVLALDKALDTTARPLEFWLAVHYYEGKWLTSKKQQNPNPQKRVYEDGRYDRKSKSKESVRYYHHQMAALMPITVMTVYRLPRQNVCKQEKGTALTYDMGSIDLLIVDEAGQVDTSVGAAAFALAKRAVVVGDALQLEPVWNVEPEVDKQIAEGKLGIPKASFDQFWKDLQTSSLTASRSSSLIKAAQATCPWNHPVRPQGESEYFDGGLFLSEHRRCLDDIIEYCNELLYDGQLKPMRGGIESRKASIDLPPMGFCPVEGHSTRSGTSRINRPEAKAIARWIAIWLPKVYDAYSTSSKEGERPNPARLIGVVSPFSAQAREVSRALAQREIREQLGTAFDGTKRPKVDPSKLARELTVGTAHRLQGAECPIVLFSLVYGPKDTPGFIENNPNLMNVAVSRAKDSFIVFGSDELMASQSGDGVLALLNYYCYPDAEHPERKVSLPAEAGPEPATPTAAVEPIPRRGPAVTPATSSKKPAAAARTYAVHTESGAHPESITQAAKRAQRAGWWSGLPTDPKSLNKLLEHAGLITPTPRQPTPQGKALGIALSAPNERGDQWPVYTQGALRAARDVLLRAASAHNEPARQAPSEKPLALTNAVKAAQAAGWWTDLPTGARELNARLEHAGLITPAPRRPTPRGEALGIGLSAPNEQGEQWPVYTQGALRAIARVLRG